MNLIIDIHVHSFPAGALPSRMHEATARQWAYSVWPHRDPDAIMRKIEPGFTDPKGDYLMDDLTAAGVDVGVVMMLDHGVGFSDEPALSVSEMLDHYAELQDRFPGRLFAFANVDPRRPGAEKLLRHAAQDLGLRGLKVYPPNGYYPSDPVCRPLLSMCADLGLPVLVHTAMMPHPLEGFYANPLYLAAVQKEFPELTIIFGHSGYPIWDREAMLTVQGHENSYLELSQWNWMASSDPERLVRTLARFRDTVGAHRMLFASDHVPGPRFSGDRSRLPAWVSFLRALPETAANYDVTFTQDEVDLILGGNAARILGMDASAQRVGAS